MSEANKRNISFGTDGWRGLLDSEVNTTNVTRVAQAFADYINRQPGSGKCVAVGYDGRRKSDRFARVFAEVLSGNQIQVHLSRAVIPTPVLAFHTLKQGCRGGVMVTASHNPAEYNGIKFKSSAGAPLITSETQAIEQLVDARSPSSSDEHVETLDFLEAYKKHLDDRIDFEAIASGGMHPAIDSMAGAGGSLLEEILADHGIPAQTIDRQPMNDFNGRVAEPIEKHLQPLSRLLKEGNFSLGLATDGDADRLGVMTGQGRWMNIQETILYLSEYVKNQRQLPGGLVKTLSVTDKLMTLADRGGYEIRDVQVGFKYVAETMMAMQAAFGAEESGGFGFGDHIPERDGIFSALLFCEMVAKSGHASLSSFIEARRKRWGLIYYDRIDMKYTGDNRTLILQRLWEKQPARVASWPVKEILRHHTSRGVINSLKFRLRGNPRWLLIRVSETEPVVRIYAEGESNHDVQRLLKEGKRMIPEQ